MMIKRRWLKSAPSLPFLALLAVPALPLQAQSPTPPPQHIDISHFAKTAAQDVVIPVPSEVFNALDKLGGNPNWRGQLPKEESKTHPTLRPQIAMLLGVVIADGFIAVEAKDADRVNEVGRRVIQLASALGVEQSVKEHCNAIIDDAKGDHWPEVRGELDKTQNSVNGAMNKLNDEDAARLISIAGWLRGTDALSSLVSQDYQEDRSDLLHQPDMIVTFEQQLDAMDAKKVLSNPQVTGPARGAEKDQAAHRRAQRRADCKKGGRGDQPDFHHAGQGDRTLIVLFFPFRSRHLISALQPIPLL